MVARELNMQKLLHPKIQLGHWPTPLEPMLRINDMHKGPELWVKRDDCTGLALGVSYFGASRGCFSNRLQSFW